MNICIPTILVTTCAKKIFRVDCSLFTRGGDITDGGGVKVAVTNVHGKAYQKIKSIKENFLNRRVFYFILFTIHDLSLKMFKHLFGALLIDSKMKTSNFNMFDSTSQNQ